MKVLSLPEKSRTAYKMGEVARVKLVSKEEHDRNTLLRSGLLVLLNILFNADDVIDIDLRSPLDDLLINYNLSDHRRSSPAVNSEKKTNFCLSRGSLFTTVD